MSTYSVTAVQQLLQVLSSPMASLTTTVRFASIAQLRLTVVCGSSVFLALFLVSLALFYCARKMPVSRSCAQQGQRASPRSGTVDVH